MGSHFDNQCWRRCPSLSRFSKTGPRSRRTRLRSTPDSSSSDSSAAFEAAASTPSTQPTRSPRRAAVSEQYVAEPPRRHPLASSEETSRDAAPTTTRSKGAPDCEGYTRGASTRILPLESNVFFYELREGDDNIFA